jgi:hypothetical protein
MLISCSKEDTTASNSLVPPTPVVDQLRHKMLERLWLTKKCTDETVALFPQKGISDLPLVIKDAFAGFFILW